MTTDGPFRPLTVADLRARLDSVMVKAQAVHDEADGARTPSPVQEAGSDASSPAPGNP